MGATDGRGAPRAQEGTRSAQRKPAQQRAVPERSGRAECEFALRRAQCRRLLAATVLKPALLLPCESTYQYEPTYLCIAGRGGSAIGSVIAVGARRLSWERARRLCRGRRHARASSPREAASDAAGGSIARRGEAGSRHRQLSTAAADAATAGAGGGASEADLSMSISTGGDRQRDKGGARVGGHGVPLSPFFTSAPCRLVAGRKPNLYR